MTKLRNKSWLIAPTEKPGNTWPLPPPQPTRKPRPQRTVPTKNPRPQRTVPPSFLVEKHEDGDPCQRDVNHDPKFEANNIENNAIVC